MSSKPRTFICLTLIVLLSVVAAVFLAEQTLWHLEKERRKVDLDYGNTLRTNGLGPGGYLKENLDIFVNGGTGKVRWHNNAAGFRRDQETTEYPPPGTLRILSLGDSFTVGYRVGQEETFSYLLEDWLNRHYGRSEVLIADIEEPATGLYYLERFGIQFHPQVVLLGITLGNDIAQAYLALDPRGTYILPKNPGAVLIEKNPVPDKIGFQHGLENLFLPDDYLQPRGPLEDVIHRARCWWRTLLLVRALRPEAVAITSWYDKKLGANKPRLFDAINGLGVYTDPAPPAIQEAYRRLFRILEGYKAFCEPRGIFLAVLLFPQRFQVNPRDWDRAVAEYSLRASRFDLMGPNKKIRDFCREHHLFLIDPTAAMAAYCARSGINLYLPRGDMHWNREGHRAFFESVRSSVGELVAAAFKKVQSARQPGP